MNRRPDEARQLRPSGRRPDEIRQITIETGVSKYAEGSCLIKLGNTHLICTATVDDTVPPFLRGKRKGWVTAEYNMLPRATHSRMKRESILGKQSGRTQEIQRLISRSLRAVVDLEMLGERQIIVDCDVIQADGGTRTAAITGGFVALYIALSSLVKKQIISKNPIITEIAAISCGVYESTCVVDLDYIEDSNADVDGNFVLTAHGSLVEVQTTGEKGPFSEAQLHSMIELAKIGVNELITEQRRALGIKL